MEEATMTKEVPTQSAEKFIADVRRKTRRKFSSEEKIRIVLEGVCLQRFREFYWPELVCGSSVRAILYA